MAKKKKNYLKVNDRERYRITKIKQFKWKVKDGIKTKVQGATTLRIFDKQTKKAISLDRFAKLFNTTSFELNYIKHDSVKNSDTTAFAFYLIDNGNFKFSIDTNDLEELKKYKGIKYNGKKVSFKFAESKIQDFLSRIEITYMKFTIMVTIKNQYADFKLIYDIINNQHDIAESNTSYIDEAENCIIIGS